MGACCGKQIVLEQKVVEEPTQLDLDILDNAMLEVYNNQELQGDQKMFHYYRALENYLYKRRRSFTPLQFQFEIREDDSGHKTHILRGVKGPKKKKQSAVKYLLCIPPLVGPTAGAVAGACLKG